MASDRDWYCGERIGSLRRGEHSLVSVRFAAISQGKRVPGLGRQRLYVKPIAFPQTWRSSWNAKQPTTKRVMLDHHPTVRQAASGRRDMFRQRLPNLGQQQIGRSSRPSALPTQRQKADALAVSAWTPFV